MTSDRKFVALAFHPWTHLEAGARLSGAPSPWSANLLPLPVKPGAGLGIGFLTVYPTRQEAEEANPGVEVLEIESEVPE